MHLKNWLHLLAFLVAAGLGQATYAEPAPATGAEARPEIAKKAVDSRRLDLLTCISCHKDVRGVATRSEHYHGNCESCHKGIDEHRQSLIRGESGKGGAIAAPQSAECLACHKNNRKLMNWEFSVHNKAGGQCSDCHTIHAPQNARGASLTAHKLDNNSSACLKCHQDASSQFRMRSHHPILEGGMGCASCHNPHGSDRTELKSRSEQCLACHQSHRGPKVFEHAPVVDDCLNCHAAHGTPNRSLLSTSQPSVCLQCHSIASGKHGFGTGPEPAMAAGSRPISGAVLRGCTNCHRAVHGSQQDPLLRY